jgi:hypothetical protein
VFNEISYHFPKADPNDGDDEADVIYLASDPIWNERYFDISADPKTIEDAHKAYAKKHTISNIRKYVNEDLKVIINKSNQYIKTFLHKTSTRHNFTEYDGILFTHFEKQGTHDDLKENTNIFLFVKKCIKDGYRTMDGAGGEYKDVEDRQARLFLLNLILVDIDTVRNFSYESLFLGDHQRQNRPKLGWSFRLKPKNATETSGGGERNSERDAELAVSTYTTKNQAFYDFRTIKRKLNPVQQGQQGQQGQHAFGDVAAPGGVHIQNINEVHYHVQNDDYEPDLSGLEQARRKGCPHAEACRRGQNQRGAPSLNQNLPPHPWLPSTSPPS